MRYFTSLRLNFFYIFFFRHLQAYEFLRYGLYIFSFYLQLILKDPPVYILPYIHTLYITERYMLSSTDVLHSKMRNAFQRFPSYACKSMPRKKKEKCKRNPRAFRIIDGNPSFVGKTRSTKRKLRNWERISRVEL